MEPTAPVPERPSRLRAPRIYYLLAAFDVLTVSASLYLNHRIMGIYVHSVEANQEWAARMADYSALGQLAAEVNAPGNDVFDSGDVPGESARMQRALGAFKARLAALRTALPETTPRTEAEGLLERTAEIELAMEGMVAETRLIFSFFADGRRDQAGQRMATMDRSYARLLGALRELSVGVAAIQRRHFASQTAAAAALQRFEYVIGVLILLMVAAATVYGRRLQVQAAGAAQERAAHIRRLQEAGESLRGAMSTMESLVAGVAHEVRNPLFGISSTLDAFEARYGKAEPFRRYVGVLRQETDRLGVLMRDLLDYGKPPGLDLAPVGLESVVDEAVRIGGPMARTAGVQIVKEPGFRAKPFPMDRWRILQVLQNVIQNAIQHSPEGAAVFLSGGERHEGGRDWAWCAVRDCGPGLPADDTRRIFEPFFTRRSGGTGLGLSIAQRIVTQHGGVIDAANHPQGGAIVTVTLPADGGATGSAT